MFSDPLKSNVITAWLIHLSLNHVVFSSLNLILFFVVFAFIFVFFHIPYFYMEHNTQFGITVQLYR